MTDFDASQPIVMARFGQLAGHNLNAGAPLAIVAEPSKPGEVDLDTAGQLWASGRAVYADMARPTPVETPLDAAKREADFEDLGGGWFLLRAPWLPDGAEKVQGEQAARDRLAVVIEAGVAYYTTLAEGTVVLPGEPDAETDAVADQSGAAEFAMTEAGSNGYYDITGPGLAEPLRIRGKANAEAKLAELRGETPAGTADADD